MKKSDHKKPDREQYSLSDLSISPSSTMQGDEYLADKTAFVLGQVTDCPPLSARGLQFAFWRLLVATGQYKRTLVGAAFPEPSFALPPCWLGNAEHGRAIIDSGTWTLNERTVHCGHNPWKQKKQGKGFVKDAHSFDWLWDLRAVGGTQSIQVAQNITREWLKNGVVDWAVSWQSDVVGRRLMAWLTHFDYFFADSDSKLRYDLLKSMGEQARHLRRVAGYQGRGLKRIVALRSLVVVEMLHPGNHEAVQMAHQRLQAELQRQILDDGMHIQRSPMIHFQTLRHLVALRASILSAHEQVPIYLQKTIEKMIPMVHFFRQQDGGFAIFNHSNEHQASDIDHILGQADVRAKAVFEAPHGGFQRLQLGRLSLWLDVGKTPPKGLHKQCCAGALSFNMSHGKYRIVVNGGASMADDETNRQKLRSSHMQSTLTIDGHSSLNLDSRGFVIGQYDTIWGQRLEGDGHILLAGGHDGYKNTHGMVHKRRIYVNKKGNDIRGEDILISAPPPNGKGYPFALYFHLHPHVQVSIMHNKSSALLRLKSGMGWRFICRGATMRLEESTYYGYLGKPVRNSKIVLESTTEKPAAEQGTNKPHITTEHIVRWKFESI